MRDVQDRDPVNVLGELIEDAVIRHSGQVGTVASARVAEEVIERLRSDAALAAAVLGDTLEWGVSNGGDVDHPYPLVTQDRARAQRLAGVWEETVVVRRAAGRWQPEVTVVVPRG